MFDFVRDIIASDDVYGIECIIDEMEGLIDRAKDRLKEITKDWEGEDDEEYDDEEYEDDEEYDDDYDDDEN